MLDPAQRFTGLPVLTEYVDGRTWIIHRDAAYRVASKPFAGCLSTVRAGFTTDWASIPRALWRILPPAGTQGQPYGLAALWHDWLYRHQAIEGCPCRRADADAIFLEIMRYVGVSAWRARIMYRAVRMFAGIPWRRYAHAMEATR
jgi:hypothetical protein